MSQKIKNILLQVLPVTIFATFLVFTIIYSWREPTQAPPGGNMPAPINIGGTTQFKSGALGIGGVFQAQGGTANPVLNVVGGNVGIGTTDPVALLEVSGQIKITGGSPGANRVLTSDASGLASWRSKLGFPSGVIIIYSGPWKFDNTGLGTGNLSGWALCNGRNGTPDLTDRFVMGTLYASDLRLTGGTNFFSLTTSQLPPHTHTIQPDGLHYHKFYLDLGYHVFPESPGHIFHMHGPHPASFTDVWSSGGIHDHGGVTGAMGYGASIDNRPAYIQLAFIMKL